MASTLSRNRKRLIPIDQIRFLTEQEKQSYRNSIKVFRDIIMSLEDGIPLTSHQENFITKITSSTDPDTWYNASYQAFVKIEDEYMTLLRRMAQHDLAAYHEAMNPNEPPAMHHMYLCDQLQAVDRGDIKFLCISLPPGSAKSTYGSRSFCQWWLGRNPTKQYLSVAHSQTFVESEISKPNRDAIASPDYNLIFPDVTVSNEERSATFWRLEDHKGKFTCRGAGAGVAGVRANMLSLDDPIKNAEDANSKTMRDKLWRWVTADLMGRRLPGCPIILIQTRWFSDDPIGHVDTLNTQNPKALPGPVKVINIPAQAGMDDVLGRKEGEWLWEDFYGANHYETLRSTMSPDMWSSLYMGVPKDQQGEYIAADQFQTYKEFPTKENIKRIVISIDTASKANERSNYTAMLVFIQDTKGLHYLVHVERVKLDMQKIIVLIQKLVSIWTPSYVLIEDAAMGTQILQSAQGQITCPLVPHSPQRKGSKEFNFDAAVPFISTGRVLFPESAPWLTDLVNEFTAFGTGGDDDQCDAFAQYINHTFKRFSTGVKPLRMG